MKPCAFRDISDYAVHVDALTGRETRAEVWLCSWPVTLAAMPPWASRAFGGGIAIDPERDCAGCRVRYSGEKP